MKNGNESRFSEATYDNALEFVKCSPHAVTRDELARHIGRSATIANRVVRKMKADGLIVAERVVDARRVVIVTYRAASAMFVPPPGTEIPQTTQRAMKLTRQHESERAERVHRAPARDPLHAFLFGPARGSA